jgi:hypothetical protein
MTLGHLAAAALLTLAGPAATLAQDIVVPHHATGTFDVKVTPEAVHAAMEGELARMSIEKQFHGELEGSSRGEMLAIGNGAAGSSGAYLALERVRATLGGRTGSFALMHQGVMTRGEASLVVSVVPDSGTEGLVGITGSMRIIVEDRRHSYDFSYTLP